MEQATMQRRQTNCEHCKEEFALGYPLVTGQDERNLTIRTNCPICESPLKIALKDFLKPKVESYKGIDSADQTQGTTPVIDADTPLIIPEGTVLKSELTDEGGAT